VCEEQFRRVAEESNITLGRKGPAAEVGRRAGGHVPDPGKYTGSSIKKRFRNNRTISSSTKRQEGLKPSATEGKDEMPT